MATRSAEMTTATFDFNISTAGRVLLSLPFLAFGLMHFLNGSAMAGLVPGWLPGGVLWVYATGAANLVVGAAVATGQYVRGAALGAAGLLGAYILGVHLPGLFGEGTFQMSLQNLLKDAGMLGGALLLYASSKK